MENIWLQIKSLFRSAEESTSSNPVIHELISRSDAYLKKYETWKSSAACSDIMNFISSQFELWESLPKEVNQAIDFLYSPPSKGFAIHFRKAGFDKNNAAFLFDYLKERVQLQGYKVQISDTRTYSQNSWVETFDRHYLKPKAEFAEGQKINQRFGNILIELIFRNHEPFILKFRANSYSDQLFTNAEDFHELLYRITG
jgi:hypothetical protein